MRNTFWQQTERILRPLIPWLPLLISIVLTILAVIILSAPLFAVFNLSFISQPLYALGRLCCHQLPERSFSFFGHPWGLCARCSGFYLAFWLVAISFPLWRTWLNNFPLRYFLILLIPFSFDCLLQFLGWYPGNNWVRVTTGGLAGFGTGLTLLSCFINQQVRK
ncbi:MAG: DUF2085 domain-containing protein [bacterium]|nr:DUF2085 domain-containing protein [bacterium]